MSVRMETTEVVMPTLTALIWKEAEDANAKTVTLELDADAG